MKRGSGGTGVRWGRVFPRIRAGASLKRGVHRVLDEQPQVFPRIRAGASLKPVADVLALPANFVFSPAFVRGPH